MPNLDYWHCFHDGTIVTAAGAVPGVLEFTIDCDWLREELHPSPRRFLLRITNCTIFEIEHYDHDHAVNGFEALTDGEFDILGAEFRDGVVHVSNANSVLRLAYESELLMLDGGAVIPLHDLVEAANRAVAAHFG